MYVRDSGLSLKMCEFGASGDAMACKCGSENQKLIPADVKLYFDSGRSAAAPAFFPDVLVCLDCGLSEFRIPGGWNELQPFRRAAAG